jgi:chemotaxis signal transduction protein
MVTTFEEEQLEESEDTMEDLYDLIEPSPSFEEAHLERFVDSIGKSDNALNLLINVEKFIREKDVSEIISNT